jgi:5S rRNA maturation endonuclease (ribonuclease M5)
LSTRYEKKLEILSEILQKLSKKTELNIPVIVEGKKDVSALRRLGIRAEAVCIRNVGKVLVDCLDDVKAEEVILLVDFDDYGVTLAKNIIQYLEGKGVKVNFIFWKQIKAIVKRDVKDIEGLPSYLEKLKKHVKSISKVVNEY